MKNNKIKLLALSLLIASVGTLSVPANAMVTPVSTETALIDIRPMGAIYYEKTVVQSYYTYDSIPDSIAYSEWNNAYQYLFTGTLKKYSIKYEFDRYFVTYKGTLAGSGL